MTREERDDMLNLISLMILSIANKGNWSDYKYEISLLCKKYGFVEPVKYDSYVGYAEKLKRSDEILMKEALE